MKKRDVLYYRKREQTELERAVTARHNSARRAHLGLAELYRRALERLQLVESRANDEEDTRDRETGSSSRRTGHKKRASRS